MKCHRKLITVLCTSILLVCTAQAEAVEVKLTPNLDSFTVKHQGNEVQIIRNQDPNNVVDLSWARTSRKCPPFCPQPIHVAPGVTTVGEVEVFDFMKNKVNKGTGLIIDARVEEWHKKGTIPSSINIPFTSFEMKASDPKLETVMKKIGAKRRSDVGFVSRAWDSTVKALGDDPQRTGFWDFSTSPDLLFWCNGPWCGQSPHAIHGLLELGFPAEKILYYRGGMQMWEILGLPVIVPEEESN